MYECYLCCTKSPDITNISFDPYFNKAVVLCDQCFADVGTYIGPKTNKPEVDPAQIKQVKVEALKKARAARAQKLALQRQFQDDLVANNPEQHKDPAKEETHRKRCAALAKARAAKKGKHDENI
jgi:hypothetical protein